MGKGNSIRRAITFWLPRSPPHVRAQRVKEKERERGEREREREKDTNLAPIGALKHLCAPIYKSAIHASDTQRSCVYV